MIQVSLEELVSADLFYRHLKYQTLYVVDGGKDWHGMRRFPLRRLWHVNCEALMRAVGQNLKRLLKQRGWGRRPFPGEAVFALFLGSWWWMTRPSLKGGLFLVDWLSLCKSHDVMHLLY